jgi:Xaa-Pro aminopeptidase
LKTIISGMSIEEAAADAIGGRRGLKIGFDPSGISYAMALAMRRRFKGQVSLIPLKGSLSLLRARKSRSELEVIRKGIKLSEAAFRVALGKSDGGTTESGLAESIDVTARGMGAEGPAFETIVAGGKRAALVHAHPTGRKLSGAVVVDWGVRQGGYCTDETRTLVFGRVRVELRRLHRIVLDAQSRAIDAIRPGVRASDVDRAARDLIADAGYGSAFGHGLGHGVGLEVHERPYVGANSVDIIEEGMVFTVEPGVYLADVGGVRVEDMILVNRDGPELLTGLPRGLDPDEYL